MIHYKTAIIFGSNGQDSYYLTQLLKECRIDTIGISRKNANIIGSVANYDLVKTIIKNQKPNFIFHFAANSTTSHNVLFENHETISTGTLNILESVRLYSPKTKIFISGSAMQFKNTGEPINEKTPFEATSPYSIARIQSVYAARYYRQKFSLKIYIGYLFNHDSPLRTERHINQKIVQTALRLKNGSIEKLEIGDINVRKEFNFAGDVVNAIWLLVNQNNIFEAVIGSGKAYRIKDWIKICFSYLNMNWTEHIITKDNFCAEYNRLISDPKLIFTIGYKPQIGIEQLAKLMLK